MTETDKKTTNTMTGFEIAVIGMAGRFPGARNIHEFWQNLISGRESISFYADEELQENRIDSQLLQNPNYVKTGGGVLESKAYFDAPFFNYTPKEAELLNPQTRIFQECVWEALEDAGYEPGSYEGAIGIYAGAASSLEWEGYTLLSGKNEELGQFEAGNLTQKDFMCLQISYNLNLKGPSSSLNTACSTSLFAIYEAWKALLTGECTMAIAGGIKIFYRTEYGYKYQDGMIGSPDGHCRAFDAGAKGTVGGEGAGVVVLKRLTKAVGDRDNIYAIIKGAACNNDGKRKVGFTAPSIEAQAEVIRKAQRTAEVEPESITYVETHGTGTELGDPVEIEALKLAFNTDKKGFCRIGSIKTNIGHLDTAAGAAGFIKTVLALKYRLIPPNLHFEKPNPKINFPDTPFIVNNRLYEWTSRRFPLRAGISSFGIGGTNVHMVLEEYPLSCSPALNSEPYPGEKYRLIVLSAKSPSALDRMKENLGEYFRKNPGINLANAAYTLQVGRKEFQHRMKITCSTISEAIDILSTPDTGKNRTILAREEKQPVIFIFPGLGSHYVNVGREWYCRGTVFREAMDRCFETIKPLTGYDIKEILYPGKNKPNSPGDGETGSPESPDLLDKINRFDICGLVTFMVEYALAKWLMEWGIKPDAMVDDGLGEYAAACISGVLSLEDALTLIVTWGKSIREISLGLHWGDTLTPAELKPFLANAFLEKFEEKIYQVSLNKPQISYISSITGTWITPGEAVNPRYWVAHLEESFKAGFDVNELSKSGNAIYIELGTGRNLNAPMTDFLNNNPGQRIINLVRPPGEKVSDFYYLLDKIGELWLYGNPLDWKKFYPGEQGYRVPLPAYSFEKHRYPLVEKFPQSKLEMGLEKFPPGKNPDIADWFYVPFWKQSRLIDYKTEKFTPGNCWLVFMDECGLGSLLVERLLRENQQVVCINVGLDFTGTGEKAFTIDPAQPQHYIILLKELNAMQTTPQHVVHLWNVRDNGCNHHDNSPGLEEIHRSQVLSFYSLLYLAQALGIQYAIDKIKMSIVTANLHTVTGEEKLSPEIAPVLGPSKLIPREYPNITCRCIDITLPTAGNWQDSSLLDLLTDELTVDSSDPVIAYRGNHRWIQDYEPVRLEPTAGAAPLLREKGVYLITGGLGGIGFVLAKYLAEHVKAKLVLTGRTTLPARDEWDQWLTLHDKQDRTSIKIRKIRELEEQGTEVLTCSADAADPLQMKKVIEQTLEKLGPINGVIHCAGLPDGGLIHLRTKENTDNILAPKIKGTLILDKMLKNIDLDFFILCSSLSSIFAPMGQVGYCAANAFLDAFAYYKMSREKKTCTVSINWDLWQEVGMGVETARRSGRPWSELKDAILPWEGIEVFMRILMRPFPQVAVSTKNLIDILDTPQDYEILDIQTKETSEVPRESTHQRPALKIQYVAPTNEVEKKIAGIWERLFGFEQLGIHDNFFELGGDSLKVIMLATEVNKAFEVRIPITQIYEKPTIEDLSKDIIFNKCFVDTDLVLLNKSKNKKIIFCFPPLISYGIIYTELAQRLEDFSVYSFNYIEDEEDPGKYTDFILETQPNGPYIFLSYSMGGTLALQVAWNLEKRGYEVSDIILLDCHLLLNKGDEKEVKKEDLKPFFEMVETGIKTFKLDFLKEQIHDKVTQYVNFLRILDNPGAVKANIHMIAAGERPEGEDDASLYWDKMTLKQYLIYKGYGHHPDMLSRQNIGGNVRIIQKILENTRAG